MRRGQAGRLVRDSSLAPNERLIMFALLDRSDNDDCVIPHWRSPSLRAIEHDTGLAHATVLAKLDHLELHGWLEREGRQVGQAKGTKESGRGKSSTRWKLVPAEPHGCWCPKPDRSASDPSGKKKGQQATHLDGSAEVASAQVKMGAAPRDAVARGEKVGEYMGGPVPWDQDDVNEWINQRNGG